VLFLGFVGSTDTAKKIVTIHAAVVPYTLLTDAPFDPSKVLPSTVKTMNTASFYDPL